MKPPPAVTLKCGDPKVPVFLYTLSGRAVLSGGYPPPTVFVIGILVYLIFSVNVSRCCRSRALDDLIKLTAI